MADLTLRSVKNAPLTNQEVDDNFTNLNTDKAETDGATITNVDINSGTIDGVTIGGASAGAITGTTIVGTSFVSSGNMTFGDNDKAVFGAGSDLEIYHDGSNSVIAEVGTGNLTIQTSQLSLRNAINTEDIVIFTSNGAATLYYDNAAKLATTATGIDVTGTITADGLTVSKNGNTSVILGEVSGGDSTTVEIGKGFDSASAIEWHRSSDIDFKIQVDAGEVALLSYNYADLVSSGLDITRGSAETRVLRATVDGDISFYEDTGTTPKLFWDASAESLGIGTTSPDNLMTIQTGTYANAYVSIANLRYLSSDVLKFGFTGATGSIRAGTIDTGTYGFAVNTGDGSERMRIDSSGNVGIGTTSPAYKLQVVGDGSLYTTNNSTGSTVFRLGSSVSMPQGIATVTGTKTAVGTGYLSFGTAIGGVGPTERMRLDSSGNLLVGTTTTSLATNEGINISSSGVIFVTKDGDAPLYAGRLTSDGDLIHFRKDGSKVGSIGSEGGNTIYIVSDDTGLRFAGSVDAIVPSGAAGASRDNAISLGVSTQRFKDLYLSGGVYLGGTGAANYFDDYEEGTFTPEFADAESGGNTASVSTARGRYVKVGKLVLVQIQLDLITTTGLTGANAAYIRNLPFTTATPIIFGFGVETTHVVFSGYVSGFINASAGGKSAFRCFDSSSGNAHASIPVSNFTSGSSSLFTAFTYETA